MNQKIKELYNTARYKNKTALKKESIIVNIDNSNYSLQISGIGSKAVRLSLFIPYEDIINFHHNKHLENVLYNKINTVYPKKKKGTVWRSQWKDMGIITY